MSRATVLQPLLWARALVVVALLALVGCADAPQADLVDDAVMIDVRTPSEYAQGHLEGAVNVDVSDQGFVAEVSELPKDGQYVLYCRSGNRSGQAAAAMEELGFIDVIDAGSVADASKLTGLEVVTG
ncbi:Rhodanese-like domain-containing protein [Tessaracoccus bendigoensis DSM 12906]|uniref:Rhodanese-like domain-containing protein n=1 Tax=Tessaracoccus bendigoensis DSM 12906 TaxID=1123357 RepID=A0A1M6BS45_9ACTN|nr:rhodanese-like domain-containing protein [Tessaracoccus bendigoensis]SHI51552.1 Rhodanese-like domain-containing protein [Tessaracoccus bendigoensis DSM 12906]